MTKCVRQQVVHEKTKKCVRSTLQYSEYRNERNQRNVKKKGKKNDTCNIRFIYQTTTTAAERIKRKTPSRIGWTGKRKQKTIRSKLFTILTEVEDEEGK